MPVTSAYEQEELQRGENKPMQTHCSSSFSSMQWKESDKLPEQQQRKFWVVIKYLSDGLK